MSQIGDQKPLKNLSLLLFIAINLSVLNCDLSEAITWAKLGGLPPTLFLKIIIFVVIITLFMTGSNFGSPKII